MGKYSEIVKGKSQNSEPENHQAIKPSSNKTIKEQNSKTGNVKSSNSGNQQNIKTREPENQKTVSEDMVNLSIKVPRRLRQKWVAESRLRGTTLTAIISDYLKSELGS